jgi:hypothetical protein
MRRVGWLLKSFALGVFYAGLGTAGILGAHLLWAPPKGGQSGLQAIAEYFAMGPAEGIASSPEAPAAPSSRPLTVAPTRNAVDNLDRSGRELAVSIQQELKRVGCYTGALNGSWSNETRTAMAAFNESVKVQLSLAAPDYILLTLLQGHPQKACKSVVEASAKRRTTEQGSTPAPVRKPDHAWTTNVTEAPAPQPLPRARKTPAAPPKIVTEPTPVAVVPSLAAAAEPPAAASDEFFTSRMAIGGPRQRDDAVQSQSRSNTLANHPAGDAASPIEARAARPQERDVRATARARAAAVAATASQNRSAGVNSWRSDTFNRLSRDSP